VLLNLFHVTGYRVITYIADIQSTKFSLMLR